MNKKEIKDLIVIGYNLNQKIGGNIYSKNRINKLIDKEVEKYIKENENNNN